MDINDNENTLIDLKAAAKLVPFKPSPTAVWRWCRKGILARNGKRIYLEHRRYGRRLFTTKAALEAFAKATAEADSEHLAQVSPAKPAPVKPRSEDRRAADIAAAHDRLKKGGLMDN